MSVQGNNQFFGSFISDGNRKILEFPSTVNYIEIHNDTQYASTANPGVLKRAWFNSTMASDSYIGVKNTDGAATDQSVKATTGGFTPVDSSQPRTFGTTAVTSVTQANPAVVTSTAHGLSTGDLVHFENITAMQQISGYDFRATVTGANTFTIPIDTSGFAAAGSGGNVRRIDVDRRSFIPKTRRVVGISQATQAVIDVNLAHTYKVGDVVKFELDAKYGMTQIDKLEGRVVAVANDLQFTVNIDSSGFTAFKFPTSAEAAPGAGVNPARVIPVGQAALPDANGNIVVNSPTFAEGFKGIELGTALVGVNNDVIRWVAYSSSQLS